jgi:miniconductance mechanosensitive channel
MLDQLRELHPLLPAAAGLLALLLVALVADLIAKRLLVGAIRVLARRSEATWDDRLVEHKVFSRLAQIIPALIILSGIALVPDLDEDLARLIRNIASGYLVLMLTLSTTAAISAANAIYETFPVSRERPLKGVAQLLQILILLIGGVMVVAAVMDRSPLLLLSGLGAMTAILLLVFKDTILGLVASVQLTANDMVRVGDWVEMPQYGADGDVIDVALHTVKIQNWDKTITTVPTHKLIAESFKNWRGMSASGGRRIKRAVHLDKNTIRFLTDAEVERFKRFALLKDYVAAKERELADYNAGLEYETDAGVNQRRLTNVGTFRAYIRNYLLNHPKIHHQGMTLLVRQLPPGAEGLPIEVYCFTTTTAWGEYEDIQADIFDHLLAVAPEFGLRLYQSPAGADFAALASNQESNA